MTPKERVLTAVARGKPDRVPLDYWATAEVTSRLMEDLGLDRPEQLWERLHLDRIVPVGPRYVGPAVPKHSGGITEDLWGMRYKPQPYGHGIGVYNEQFFYPLAEARTVEDVERYRWPSADWFDFSAVAADCDRYPEYAILAGYAAPFFYFNKLRGLEQSLIDLAEDPELSEHILRHLGDFFHEFSTRLFESGRGKIHLTQVTDDFGAQTGLLISISMFRRYFARDYRRLINLAHEAGIRVFHHDDGSIREVLPDLISLGIDVLNPIQWRCKGMDRAGLKRDFGGRLCFHGAVDNQQVLPFGAPSDVAAEVRECLSTLGGGGGYILGPCHNIQPNTPTENILTMYDVALVEGRYSQGG
ncbi:MAG: uroporphyrinogen-III decarboxylase-like protein [Planctomycetes bacterium]|nr:uroporphyrinogen-III decarboxylase-like protein [Planctomycetota bacterium]